VPHVLEIHYDRWPSLAVLAFLTLVNVAPVRAGDPEREAPPLPPTLSETGLFVPGTTTPRPEHLAFTPQYPLWSDGASKRRWIALPPGTAIDATNPDAWVFPPGTRLWKEFAQGDAVETRFIERLADGTWRYATYVWNDDRRDATLALADGAVLARADAPGGRYVVPSRLDCLACHEGPAVPVLGFSALQLAADRDPLAPHAEASDAPHTSLDRLVANGVVRNVPPSVRSSRLAGRTPQERAALGYLHGNCGHCHNGSGALGALDLPLAQSAADPQASAARTRAALLDHDTRFRAPGAASHRAVDVLRLRMGTTNRLARMPPLGTQVIDGEALALVERWIRQDLDPGVQR
jgi:hypothetical protein